MLKYKHIEAAREVRLWLAQIVVPTVGVLALSPEARQIVADLLGKVKKPNKKIHIDK